MSAETETVAGQFRSQLDVILTHHLPGWKSPREGEENRGCGIATRRAGSVITSQYVGVSYTESGRPDRRALACTEIVLPEREVVGNRPERAIGITPTGRLEFWSSELDTSGWQNFLAGQACAGATRKANEADIQTFLPLVNTLLQDTKSSSVG